MWEEIVKDSSGEMIEEIERKAGELRCSLEVAHYILKLEERLEAVSIKLDELWSDYRQR